MSLPEIEHPELQEVQCEKCGKSFLYRDLSGRHPVRFCASCSEGHSRERIKQRREHKIHERRLKRGEQGARYITTPNGLVGAIVTTRVRAGEPIRVQMETGEMVSFETNSKPGQ